MKRSPLIRKRATKRRGPVVTCQRERCAQRVRALDLCASHLEQEADRLFSLKIRESGRCLAATSTFWQGAYFVCSGPLDAAHFMRRRYHATRWFEDNAVCLCRTHHGWMDANRVWLERMAASWLGLLAWEDLQFRARTGTPMDPVGVIERYRAEAA